ncbi:MAG: TetR/AcrR family transcriptional regulator [Deltaproteobacteria bacterium]|nr:TetR/AcrR family transcriptional regulator [Deltaproteobacteria bacterium]
MATPTTPDRILNVAERLAQTQGFNGFSYADIAKEVRMTKASLHYHFPSKADLGRRLLERYTAAFAAALHDIDATTERAADKLERYAALYRSVLAKNRMCLCGMLASEFTTLPKAMREGVVAFFVANEAWVAKVLDEGLAQGALRFTGPTPEAAARLVASLEGAMMLARSFGDPVRFEAAARTLLTELAAPTTQ